MLSTLRGKVGNFILKCFLGLIILSFAVWGIGDFLQPSGNQTAARVGGKAIPAFKVEQEVRRKMQEMQAMFGGQIPAPLLQGMDLQGMVLANLVREELLMQAAERMGVAVDDKVVTQAMALDPSFHNENGQFDRQRFAQLVRMNNMSEEAYIEQMRRELAVSFLMQTVLASGEKVPAQLVEWTHAVQGERRIARYVHIGPQAVQIPPSPSEDALTVFYEARREHYMRPEIRAVSYIAFSKAQLAKGDGEEALYSLANKLEDALAAGATLKEVAENFDLPAPQSVKLDQQGALPDKLPDGENFRQKAFSTEQGADSGAVLSKDQSTYYIIHVDAVTPPSVRPLAEVRAEVLKAWKEEELIRQMQAKANRVSEALGKGEKLEAVAAREKLELKTSEPLTRGTQGFSTSFTQALFQASGNQVEGVFPANGSGFVVGELKDVVPAKPLTDEQRNALSKSLAEELMQQRASEIIAYMQDEIGVKVSAPAKGTP